MEGNYYFRKTQCEGFSVRICLTAAFCRTPTINFLYVCVMVVVMCVLYLQRWARAFFSRSFALPASNEEKKRNSAKCLRLFITCHSAPFFIPCWKGMWAKSALNL